MIGIKYQYSCVRISMFMYVCVRLEICLHIHRDIDHRSSISVVHIRMASTLVLTDVHVYMNICTYGPSTSPTLSDTLQQKFVMFLSTVSRADFLGGFRLPTLRSCPENRNL